MPQKKKQADKVDKRYRAKVVIPGLDKPVWVSAKTKRELEDEKRRIKEEYVNGPRREDMPFVDLIREWWDVVKKPRIKTQGTLRIWSTILRIYVLPFFPAKKLSHAVTRKDLQACLNQADGMNANHAIVIKSILTNTCKYGIAEGIIHADPSVLLTKPTARQIKEKRPFTVAEEERILAEAEKLGGMHQALVYILYFTGVRIGEALGLRWEDVLWQKGLIHIQRDLDDHASPRQIGALKTRASNRYIPIPEPLMVWLKANRGLPKNYVVTNAPDFCSNDASKRLMSRLFYECGYYDLRDPKKSSANYWMNTHPWFSPHYFRHHYVTSCVQAELRPEYIMSIVGHASYGTTIGVYTHIQHQMLEDDFRPTKLSSILREKTKVAKRLPEQILKV